MVTLWPCCPHGVPFPCVASLVPGRTVGRCEHRSSQKCLWGVHVLLVKAGRRGLAGGIGNPATSSFILFVNNVPRSDRTCHSCERQRERTGPGNGVGMTWVQTLVLHFLAV